MFNVPPVTLFLVGLISAIFVSLQLVPGDWQNAIVINLALIPDLFFYYWENDPVSLAMAHELATLVTHALVHVDLLHWLVNVGFFLAFGALCERAFGRRRYIWLLVAASVAGAAAQGLLGQGVNTIMIGASGAVAGCFAGVIRLLVTDPDPQRQRLGWTMLAILAGLNVLFGLIGGAFMGVSGGIAWIAHIGGFLGGLAVAWTAPRYRSG
jgi:membrane associated rhomboid family serine protease